jgi:hypothetical protein
MIPASFNKDERMMVKSGRKQIFLMMAGIVTLTACSHEPFSTQWMPNGYHYQDNTPLSSPAPSRPWLKEAARPDMNKLADNTAAWQGAVYELINPLPQLVLPQAALVTLKARAPAYPADGAFDHFLRQGLMSYGYTLADAGQAGPILVYDAAPLTNKDIAALAEKKLGVLPQGDRSGMYYLTLDVIGANGRLLGSQSTLAVLPNEKGEYDRWPGFSSQPVQGWSVDKRPIYETRQ